MSSVFDEMLAQMMAMSNRLSDAVWLMEPRRLAGYLTAPRTIASAPLVRSPESLVSDRGNTAVIQIHGVMMKDPWYDDETSTPAIEQAVRLVASNPDQFENLVFDIDSPGGSSAGIAGLADAIEEASAKLNTIAQSTGMIASGAYWAAVCCNQVYAERMDWLGSIGVRMDVFDASRLFANAGVERVAIDTGPLKSTGLFGTEVTEEQRNYLKTLVADTHRNFTAVVTKGRKMSEAEFAAVATGGVFPAPEALRMKLIDGIQSLNTTLAATPRGRQTTTPTRSKTMSEPQAATIAELQSEFPDASAEFYVEQMKAGATLAAAGKAYTATLRAQLAAEKEKAEQLEAAKAKAEKDAADATAKAAGKGKAAGTVRGNNIVAGTASGETETTGDTRGEWATELAAEMAKPSVKTRAQAVRNINKRRPELREQLVALANS